MAALIGQLTEFNSATDDWTLYQERLEQYFEANKISVEKIQVATLISLVGSTTYKTIRDLCHPDLPKDKTYGELCAIMRKQLSPHVSIWRERIKFYESHQEVNECISDWYAKIRAAAINCKFGNELESILKNKFIGMERGKLLDRLCEEEETQTMEKLLQIAQQKESSFLMEINKLQVTKPTKVPTYRRYEEGISRQKQEEKQAKVKERKMDTKLDECRHCGQKHYSNTYLETVIHAELNSTLFCFYHRYFENI